MNLSSFHLLNTNEFSSDQLIQDTMLLDYQALKNLEVVENSQGK